MVNGELFMKVRAKREASATVGFFYLYTSYLDALALV